VVLVVVVGVGRKVGLYSREQYPQVRAVVALTVV